MLVVVFLSVSKFYDNKKLCAIIRVQAKEIEKKEDKISELLQRSETLKNVEIEKCTKTDSSGKSTIFIFFFINLIDLFDLE